METMTATPTRTVGKIQNKEEASISTPSVRYVLYARKSTESDEKQALSIDSQIKEMLGLARKDGLNVTEIRKESHSAKDAGQRPVFNQILEDIRDEKFNGMLAWAPDRLSRNAGDLGAIVDLMDQKKIIEIRTFGQRFTNNPNEKFLLMILGAQGKLENDQKGVNVKRGLRARCEMGLWPAPAPTGYLNEKNKDKKCHILVDPERAPIIKMMFEKIAYENWSGKKVYRWLKDDVKFTSINEKPLSLSNVYIILKNTLYYGMFQYPKGSGNWYAGKHESLITKELYNRVQEQIKRSEILNPWGSKEFAFTKLITCGFCGAMITADEKFKKLKNGDVNRHVYYGCSKRWQDNCKCGFIKEEELIEQIAEILDTTKLNKIGVREKIEKKLDGTENFKWEYSALTEKKIRKQKK